MKKINASVVLLLLISVLLTACAPTAAATPSFETVVAGTMSVIQTQQAIISTITPYVPPTETAIPPTMTASPTTPPNAVVTITQVSATPSQAYCISTFSNVNVPNNTAMKGGSSFTKTWSLTNGGSASWGSDFKLVFVSGDSMNAVDVPLGRTVNPGSSINVSANLIAPTAAGDHRANFMLVTDKGEKFGIGPNCDRPFYLMITTSGLFQVTAASVSADPSSYTGACPVTINLTASISANGVGTTTYVFRTSQGNSDTYQIDFTGSGTATGKTIPIEVTGSTTLEAHIYISEPNHQDFGTISIPITCTP